MTTLTQNEIVALELTLNYKTREAQLEDNFSDADVMDIDMKLGWKKNKFKVYWFHFKIKEWVTLLKVLVQQLNTSK